MIDFDAVLAHDAADEILVADVADDERGVGRHRPAEAGRQIVEHDDALPASRSSSTMWLPM